jgi:hypothetical protein
VEIENDDGDTKRFRIVGYDEIFGRKDYISIDSPMARALLKKRSAIWPSCNTPAGEASWYVNEIEYVNSPNSERPARLAFCRVSPYNYPLIFDSKMIKP